MTCSGNSLWSHTTRIISLFWSPNNKAYHRHSVFTNINRPVPYALINLYAYIFLCRGILYEYFSKWKGHLNDHTKAGMCLMSWNTEFTQSRPVGAGKGRLCSTRQSPSCPADICFFGPGLQQNSGPLLLLDPILSQMKPIHTPPSHLRLSLTLSSNVGIVTDLKIRSLREREREREGERRESGESSEKRRSQ
jgi:hypothetical protein